MKANDEFFIDNSQDIIQELEAKTTSEIASIKAADEKAIREYEKKANADVADIRVKAERTAEAAVKTLKSNKARNLESEQKRMILMEKQILIRKILEMTHNYFLSLKDDARYIPFMVNMLDRSLPLFQGAVRISGSSKLEESLKKYMKDHPGHEFSVEKNDALDGFILSDMTGHVVSDNTLEGIWRRRKEDVIRQINNDVDALVANLDYCRTLGHACESKN